MFGKIFSQIFDSSISDDYLARHVFMDLIVLADKDGVVDMTPQAIARRTNVPEEIVRAALTKLLSPDPHSRSTEENGARIVPIDSHRDWGWQLVNYQHYRFIADEEARKSYFRDYKRTYRNRNVQDKSKTKLDSLGMSKVSTQAEAEVKAKKYSRSTLEEIYDAYPRHIGKEAALKAIEKALEKIKPHDPAWLLEIVKGYAKTRQGEDAQFTPYPATWFNQGRYTDGALQVKTVVKTRYEESVERQAEERRQAQKDAGLFQ